MSYLLSIDQGTTGTTALIANHDLNLLAKKTVNFKQIYPKPGWVEHSGEDIWNSVKEAVTKALHEAGLKPTQIDALGITNQRETVAVFDSSSRLLHNLVVWQCKRSQPICNELKSRGFEKLVREKTGLLLDPYFSATKLLWLFREYPEFRKHLFGTVDTWLLHKLSAGQVHLTDATNASRTLLMNLKSLSWDEELLEIFQIPKTCLPEIKSSSEVYAQTKNLSFLPDGIPIASLVGDQQSALFAQGCFEKGQAKATFGTGCFILCHTGTQPVVSKHGLLSSVALQTQTQTTYCLEASSFTAGAAVSWLKDNLGLISKSGEIEALAKKCESSENLVFIPALSGLGAPYWKPEVKGAFLGISRDTNKAHFARAVLESIALLNEDMLEAIRQEIGDLNFLKVDGGASSNNLLMQLQADLSNLPCLRSKSVEATAFGALILAGLATKIFDNQEIAHKLSENPEKFTPQMQAGDKLKLKNKWRDALKTLT